MAIRVVRFGTKRSKGEGTRIGTVRRPPRGVPKSEFASQDWYDVWLPNIAPTAELMKLGQAVESEKEWGAFVKKYRAEMANPEKRRVLDLLAVLSHSMQLPNRLRQSTTPDSGKKTVKIHLQRLHSPCLH